MLSDAPPQKSRKLLVTIALPYANGLLHLGHLLEAIQADIWVRFQKMRGHDCLFICGNDAHGTSIMLSAEKQNISPETLIAQVHKEHLLAFNRFSIDFDNFYTTHSSENKALSATIYKRLKDNGDIVEHDILQAFDCEKQIFLADRLIQGTCPRCNAADQHGDSCEVCGATYKPTELIHPRSVLSDTAPITKRSTHYFFQLSAYESWLKRWIQPTHLPQPIINKLQEWFDMGLRDWDISRDAPYFGFEIPDVPGKFFYVWLDAPIGYMASFQNLCKRHHHLSFEEYWGKDSHTELYHFIGKDIVYFHALFWPAMLHASGYRLPTALFVHGFLTIAGQKMSKSRGTFITAEQYAQHLDPELLRYYLAAKLTGQVEDVDLNFEDLRLRVNADLVGKYINLASRCARLIEQYFDGRLATQLHDETLLQPFIAASNTIANSYETRNTNRAVRDILALTDQANQYIDQHKPWILIKTKEQHAEAQAVCTQGLNYFRLLTLYMKPILPNISEQIEHFLNIPPLQWDHATTSLLDHKIRSFKPLIQRILSEQITALTEIQTA